MRINELKEEELFRGHKACAGCGASLVVRWTLKVLGQDTVAVIPAGCVSAVSFVHPNMAFGINAIISPFAATAALLSGIREGLDSQGKTASHVIGFAGDGATADIGLQALSGALNRRDRFIYLCYDNEGYMNTGMQKSSATPAFARTSTSPEGFRPRPGQGKKDLLALAAAHHIPYAASASLGYPFDFLEKVKKASQVDGPSFIHVLAPCPSGWGSSPDNTANLGKLAVDTGLWPLLEYEDGTWKINRRPENFKDLGEWFKSQGRFKGLEAADYTYVEQERAAYWAEVQGRVQASKV